MDKVLDKAIDWSYNQIIEVVNCDQNIEKLRRTLKRIQCLLVDAEERREIEDDFVRNWLLELKNSAFNAEDVLDRYDTLAKLKSIVSTKNMSVGEGSDRKRTKMNDTAAEALSAAEPSHNYYNLRQRYDFSSDIDEINNQLNETADSRRNYKLDGPKKSKTRKIQASGSSVSAGVIVGRKVEKQRIVELLISDDVGNGYLPVIPICGVAGVGKTVLAQLAFDAVEVQNYFDKRIWVYVQNGADIERITREIIEAIRGRKQEVVSLNLLQEKLRGLLTRSKFLLVLDNLSQEDSFFWENFQLPMLAGALGSKVLITTRSTVVCRGMKLLCKPDNLPGLGLDDGWELLRNQVFPNGGWDYFPELESIGRQIVERCQGSPLVSKSLSAILYGETDEREWSSLLSQMGPLRDNNVLVRSLMISYRNLDYHLKKCFAYCSALPDGYEFCKEDLVRMWIAEGLVQPSGHGRRGLEAIGGRYFDELFWRLFFETCGIEKEKYRMPSLFHDLACLVSKHETLVLEDNSLDGNGEIHSKLGYRYCCISHQKNEPLNLKNIFEFQRLRMLFTHSAGSRVHLKDVPPEISRNLKFLRVLNLGSTDIRKLPDSVGDLLQLRYLGLSNTDVKMLPESVCKLYNLQTINLSECYKFEKLPEGLSSLVNLRHITLDLQWDKIVDLHSMPNGIDNITSLETLSRFTVTNDMMTGRCNITEMKNLELRGELCISKLERIANSSVVGEAKLQEKCIDKLML